MNTMYVKFYFIIYTHSYIIHIFLMFSFLHSYFFFECYCFVVYPNSKKKVIFKVKIEYKFNRRSCKITQFFFQKQKFQNAVFLFFFQFLSIYFLVVFQHEEKYNIKFNNFLQSCNNIVLCCMLWL